MRKDLKIIVITPAKSVSGQKVSDATIFSELKSMVNFQITVLNVDEHIDMALFSFGIVLFPNTLAHENQSLNIYRTDNIKKFSFQHQHGWRDQWPQMLSLGFDSYDKNFIPYTLSKLISHFTSGT